MYNLLLREYFIFIHKLFKIYKMYDIHNTCISKGMISGIRIFNDKNKRVDEYQQHHYIQPTWACIVCKVYFWVKCHEYSKIDKVITFIAIIIRLKWNHHIHDTWLDLLKMLHTLIIAITHNVYIPREKYAYVSSSKW